MQEMIENWFNRFGFKKVTASDILELAPPEALKNFDINRKGLASEFGKYLTSLYSKRFKVQTVLGVQVVRISINRNGGYRLALAEDVQISVLPNDYAFVSPDGETCHVRQSALKAFCEKHGLEPALMSMVHRGVRKTHKGWSRYQPHYE